MGGAALGLAGVPAGWLSGSILAVAGAALAGRPMFIPTLLMRAIFILIGISLGAVVTPETLHGMATYPLSICSAVVGHDLHFRQRCRLSAVLHMTGARLMHISPLRLAACHKFSHWGPNSAAICVQSQLCRAFAS